MENGHVGKVVESRNTDRDGGESTNPYSR
jgi:hypothetical protein